MKKQTSIILLSATSLCIIVFWLLPGINTAKNVNYVRYYENVQFEDSTGRGNKNKTKPARKVYKKETIKSDKPKVTGKIFSRAMQFLPYESDSLELVATKDLVNTRLE